MPAPPNGRVLLFDPSTVAGFVGWWSARAPESSISTGATRARDLSGNNQPMAAITPGASVGYLGWGPDPAVAGGPAFSQDLATSSADGLVATIPSMGAPLSIFLVAWAATGTSAAEIFALNNSAAVGNQARISVSTTTWTGRISSTQTISATSVALGVAHVVHFTQDVNGNTCSLYVDDPYTAKATATAASTPTGLTNAVLLSNGSSATNKGGRVSDVLVFSSIPNAGARYNLMRLLASLNKLPLQRLFGGY